MRSLACITVFCLGLSAALAAQQPIPQVDDTTLPPVHTPGHWFIEGPHETVNPENGQVSLRFDVALPPGRQLSPVFSIAYDSAGAQNVSWAGGNLVESETQQTNLASDGWSYTVPQLTYNVYTAGYCNVTTGYVFQGPDGSRRPLQLSITGYYGQLPQPPITACDQMPGQYESPSDNQGDGWLAATTAPDTDPYAFFPFGPGNGADFINEPVTVTSPDGTQYMFAGMSQGTAPWGEAPYAIVDRNGNTMAISVSAVKAPLNAITYTDTLGRTVLATSGFAQSSDTLTTGGYGTYTADWANEPGGPVIPLDEGTCTESHATAAGGGQAITSLTTPEGTYTFSYDPTYGMVNQITYPNGGVIAYTWGLPGADNEAVQLGYVSGNQQTPNGCAAEYQHPVVQTRTVYDRPGHMVQQQSFSYATSWASTASGAWSSKTTTVATVDEISGENATVQYSYTPGPGGFALNAPPQYDNVGDVFPYYRIVATQVPLEQSAVTQDGGATLQTVNQTWNGGFPALLTDHYTTMNTSASGGPQNWQHMAYNTNGQITEKDEYDYGSGGPGPLLRATGVSYASFSQNIVDRPSSITVCTVDTESSPCISGSPYRVSEADYPVYDANANLKTVSKWVSGSNFLTTQFGYDQYGNRTSIEDPAGNTTTISYSGATGENAYVTSVTDALNHTDTYTWNDNAGTMATHVDQNSNTTSFTYNDPWGRLTQVNYPDGGETTFAYTPATLETKRLQDTQGDWEDALTTFDGLGRDSADATETSAGVWSRVETCYNGMGEKATVTYPFYGAETGAATCPTPAQPYDSFTWDALGRPRTTTHSDGTTFLTTYAGRATETQDEGYDLAGDRITRILQVNGLGQLSAVCEETNKYPATEGASSAPAACGLDSGPNLPAATGYLTNYTHDPLGNLTAVSQGTLLPRSFIYDGLSRLLSATNPENGTVTYTWDTPSAAPAGNQYCATHGTPSAPGDLVQRTDARGVSACYSWDGLHRRTGTAYSDSTPPVTLIYDQPDHNGWPAANPIGRLTSEYAGTLQGNNNFSYDKMGRVVWEQMCLPLGCGIPGTQVNNYASYDLAGDRLTTNTGPGATLTVSYDLAGRPTAMASSVNGSLIANVQYNALGEETAATLGNGVSETRGYDPRGRLNAIAEGSAYNWSANGAGQMAGDGDLLQSSDSVLGNYAYQYNDLNQLTQACNYPDCHGDVDDFYYDRYGNRWRETANWVSQTYTSFGTFDQGNNNRFDQVPFDASGGMYAPNYTYDAEERLTVVMVNTQQPATYGYDAEGRRIESTVSGVPEEYIYGRDGSQTVVDQNQNLVAAETYFGGRYLGTQTPQGFVYAYANNVGSVHMRSNGEAGWEWAFGEFQNYVNGTSPLHFSGKVYDVETGYTYFGARFYRAYDGRFMTPDWSANPEPIPYANLSEPQTLNLYAYAGNNPVTNTDADGHCCDPVSTTWDLIKWAAQHPAAAARVVQGVEGAGMVVGGIVGVAASSGAGVAATPVTGGASDYAGAIGAAASTGVAVAGSVKLMAAITGSNDPKLPAAESAVETMANPIGAAVTAASGGNLKAGEIANTITGGAQMATDVANAASLTALQKAGAVANALGVASSVKGMACKEQTPCGQPAAMTGATKQPGSGN